MKLSQNSGNLLIGTGIIHKSLGLVMGRETLGQILDAGFINSINVQMDRNAIFWFLFGGFMMMILGKLMQDFVKGNKGPLPASLGYYLLLITTTGCHMMPVSGFWIVIPQLF